MQNRRAATPEKTRKSALALLSTGKITLPEMATILGVSTHMIWNWCRIAGVDWRKARLAVIANEWRKMRGY